MRYAMSTASSGRRRATSTAAVVTVRVESGRDLESGGDLESFEIKNEITHSGLLFIGSKISATVLL
jgi:hypothetical protein